MGRFFQRLLAVLLATWMTVFGAAEAYAGAAFGPGLQPDGTARIVPVRFISPDTMDPTMPGVGTNRYSYSQNDPVNKSDPNGHLWGVLGGIIAGAIGALFGGTREANTPKNDNDVSNTSEADSLENMVIGAIGGGALARNAKGIVVGKKKPANEDKQGADSLDSSVPNPAESEWANNITADAGEIVPGKWGPPTSTKKGVGIRWLDPNKKGNGIRIDRGNPNSTNPSQQVDHVVINSEGKIIGRDGNPIKGSIKDDPVNAHVPYKDWLGWREWNKP